MTNNIPFWRPVLIFDGWWYDGIIIIDWHWCCTCIDDDDIIDDLMTPTSDEGIDWWPGGIDRYLPVLQYVYWW